MARRSTPSLPAVDRVLVALGQNIQLARKRRNLAAGLLAERAGMSRPTLRAIERGDGGVTLGAIANVLHSLGLERDLAAVAQDDVLGRKLDDAHLEQVRRVSSRKRPRDA